MLYLRPREIRFSQDSIRNRFDEKSYHSDVPIGETLDELIEERITVDDIPTISVQKMNGQWFTADNRRLWVFQMLELIGKCHKIPVRLIYNIPFSKLTTTNEGKSVTVRRGDPGGRYYFALKNVLNQHSENEETSNAKIEELKAELDKSRKTVQEWAKKVQVLSSSVKSIEIKLSESEKLTQQYKNLLRNIAAEKGTLDKLSDTRERLQKVIKAYQASTTKLKELERENEFLKHSQTVTGNKQTEATTSSKELPIDLRKRYSQYDRRNKTDDSEALKKMSKELEETKEKCKHLETETRKFQSSARSQIESLWQQNAEINAENEKLKKSTVRLEKQISEIRRLTVCLYGLVQEGETHSKD